MPFSSRQKAIILDDSNDDIRATLQLKSMGWGPAWFYILLTFSKGKTLVLLSGNLADSDELQFLTKKDNGEFILQKTVTVAASRKYSYAWSPSEPGK